MSRRQRRGRARQCGARRARPRQHLRQELRIELVPLGISVPCFGQRLRPGVADDVSLAGDVLDHALALQDLQGPGRDTV